MPAFETSLSTSSRNPEKTLISTMMAGAFIGALASGPLADFIGRKALMSLGLIIFVFGDIMQVGADQLQTLYGGRAVSGVSIG